MVVLLAILIDVVAVSVGWWATVNWQRRRKALARYERELEGATTLLEKEPQPEVFDYDTVASTTSAATEVAPPAAEAPEPPTVRSAVDGARDLEPVAATSVAAQGADTPMSEMLRARLLALRETPGLSVAREVNGSHPHSSTAPQTSASDAAQPSRNWPG